MITLPTFNLRLFVCTILGLCCSSEIARPANFTTLVSFNNTNGAIPLGLIQSVDGDFYGTTTEGGTPGAFGTGTIFRMAPDGTLTTLYVFSGATNGILPRELTEASDGNLYGCTYSGGSTNQSGSGDGTIFRITPSGAFTTLCSFYGTNGANPTAALIQGLDGSFYGSTLYGGIGYNGSYNSGTGTVFRVTTNGILTTLAYFADPLNGIQPNGRLAQTTSGDLFGMTRYGGTTTNLYQLGEGTVFKLATNGTLTTLLSFNGTNGSIPSSGLMLGADGNLYGETTGGGTGYPGVYSGTAFALTQTGTLTTLHSFAGGADGVEPIWQLIQATNGILYGISFEGPTNVGTVFMLTTNGNLTTLYTFSGGQDGSLPTSLVLGQDGNLYGTTEQGGTYGYGTVFRVDIALRKPLLQAISCLSNSITFSWNATIGQTYQVQYTTNLTQNAWNNLGTPITATNEFESAFDSEQFDQQRFYRVMLGP